MTAMSGWITYLKGALELYKSLPHRTTTPPHLDMLSLSFPLSLYAIPAMWVISYYPVFARSAILSKADSFNNVQPRSNMPGLSEKKNISPNLAAKLHRLEGAHVNGLENMPFFGLAVLTGNFAGIDNSTLNTVSALYLVWRLAYNYAYINQATEEQAARRSLTWLTSLAFPFYLFIKSASVIGQKSL